MTQKSRPITIGILFSENASLADGLFSYFQTHPEFASHFQVRAAFTNHAPSIVKRNITHNSIRGYRVFSKKYSFLWTPGWCDVEQFAHENHVSYQEFLLHDELRRKYFMDHVRYSLTLHRTPTYSSTPVDIVICAGFDLLLPDEFIQHFGNIIKEHPADLSILDENGKSKFAGHGKIAVSKVIHAEEKKTRSTIHLIEPMKGINEGRILCIGPSIKIPKKKESATIPELQNLMDSECATPALVKALRLILEGRIELPRKLSLGKRPSTKHQQQHS